MFGISHAVVNKGKEFIKYCLIGAMSASLDFGLFVVLNNFGLHYQAANAVSVCAGITNSFFLNAFFNFRITDRLLQRYAAFFAVGLLGLLISAALLFLFVEMLGIAMVSAKAVTIVLVAITQYVLNSTLTFKRIT